MCANFVPAGWAGSRGLLGVRRLDWNPVAKQRRRLARACANPLMSVSQQAFVKHTTAKLLLTKQKLLSTEKCEFSELLEGCGPSANKTLKKRIKSFGGAVHQGKLMFCLLLI